VTDRQQDLKNSQLKKMDTGDWRYKKMRIFATKHPSAKTIQRQAEPATLI